MNGPPGRTDAVFRRKGDVMSRIRLQDLALVALPFLLLNATLVLRPAPATVHREGPTILSARTAPWDAIGAPDDADPGTVQEVRLRFDAAMVEPARVGRISHAGELTLEPPVDGVLIWEDEATLRFEAREPLPVATAFVATVREDLTDRRGRALAGSRARRFATGRLRVRSLRFRRFDGHGHPVFDAWFNLPVLPASLAQHVAARAGDVRASVAVGAGAPSHHVTFSLDRTVTGPVEIRFAPGLGAAGGAVPLGRESVFEVEAREKLAPWFADPRREAADRVVLPIRFNRPVDPGALRRHLVVEPAIETALEGTGERLSLVGDFRRGKRYVVTVRAGLRAGPAVLEESVRRVFHPPDRRPQVSLVTQGGRYLGGRGARAIEVRAVNLPEVDLLVERIEPEHVAHRLSGVATWTELTSPILSRRVVLGGSVDEDVVRRIDLAALLGDEARGVLRVTVRKPNDWPRSRTMVVLSDLGLGVDLGARQATVRVASLTHAEPVRDVRVRLVDAGGLLVAEGRTDARGRAVLPRERFVPGREPTLLLAETDSDASFLQLVDGELDRRGLPVRGKPWIRGLLASVHPDRGIYRPGESVRVKTYVRRRGARVPPDLPIALRLIRPDGRALPETIERTGDAGTAALTLPVPEWGPTGAWRVEARVPGGRGIGEARIRVEEYLPDRLRVTLEAPDRRYAPGETLVVRAEGRLLAGPPAARCRVTGSVRVVPERLRLAGWDGWRLGDEDESPDSVRLPLVETTLDDDGVAGLPVELPRIEDASRPLRVTASVSVHDHGGRAVTARLVRRLDPRPAYLALRDGGVSADGVRRVEVAAVRPDGTIAEEVTEVRLDLAVVTWSSWWEWRRDGSWRYRRDRTLAPLATRRAALVEGRGSVEMRLPDRRDVSIRAEADGAAAARVIVGSAANRPPERPAAVEMRLDRDVYRPGDLLTVELVSPHAGRLLWQLQDEDVLLEGEEALAGKTGRIRFRIPETDAPGLHLVTTVLRPVEPGRTGLPRAYGVVRVPLLRDPVDLRVEAPEEIRAGSRLTVTLETRGPEGPLADVDLCVFLVDEGILALTGHRVRDPGEAFLAPRRCGTTRHDLYGRLLPSLRHLEDAATGGGDGGTAEAGLRLNPIRARRVDPLVDWRPSVRTDAAGRATVAFDLPDRTGQIRLMALAARDRRFAATETSVRLTRPLDVHAHLPRFLAPGDRVDVPVEITSTTLRGTARLAIRTEGPIEVVDAPETADVAPGAAVPVVLRLRALGAGVAAVEVTARLGDETARQRTELPVRPAAPRTREAGTIPLLPGEEATVGSTGAWLAGTRRGGLVLSRSPRARLTGGLEHLVRYPYGCLEQTTSAAFPLVHLGDLARSAGLVVDDAAIRERVQAGVDRVLSMATRSGGLALWIGERRPHPWGSCWAAHFLIEARRAGYDVPPDDLDRLLAWLGREGPSGGGSVATYAAYVRALAGLRDLAALERLAARAPDLADWQRELLLTAGRRAGAFDALPPRDPASEAEPATAMGTPTRDLAIRLLARVERDPRRPRPPGADRPPAGAPARRPLGLHAGERVRRARPRQGVRADGGLRRGRRRGPRDPARGRGGRPAARPGRAGEGALERARRRLVLLARRGRPHRRPAAGGRPRPHRPADVQGPRRSPASARVVPARGPRRRRAHAGRRREHGPRRVRGSAPGVARDREPGHPDALPR
jgi:uncharacterized protein YfaS (alpha-2-macroglobulin family)